MPIGFTDSQVRAWDYVRSSFEEGTLQTHALTAYRDAGEHIGTTQWNQLWRMISGYAEQWEQQRYFKPTDTYPEKMWGEAPRNFAKKYVAEVKLQWRNLLNDELETTFRYVEADHRMSESEIRQGIDDILDERSRCSLFEPEGMPTKLEFIYGYNLFKTQGR